MLLISVLTAIIIISICGVKKATNEETLLLKKQAAKRNGVFNKSFFSPNLIFAYSDINFYVYFDSGSADDPREFFGCRTCRSIGIYTSDLHFPNINSYGVRIDPYGSGFGKFIVRRVSKKITEIHNHVFDEVFCVESKDINFVNYMLTPQMQDVLLMYKHKCPSIRIWKNGFRITFDRHLEREKDYDDLINIALTVCDRLKKISYRNSQTTKI